jgi:hypothetical protein
MRVLGREFLWEEFLFESWMSGEMGGLGERGIGLYRGLREVWAGIVE